MAEFTSNNLLQPKTRNQLLATVIVNIITFGHGMGIGWLSPTLSKIQTNTAPLDFRVSVDEISWLGSMLGLGSLCGNITIAILLERVGRKYCIYLLAAPYACLWILVYCATNVGYLYAARFLCGFTGGAGYSVLPIFISEIADSSIRGSLSSMVMLSVNFGVLIGFILATYLDYHIIPFLGIILSIAYFAATLLLPETPPYLLKHKRLAAAETSYKYYKNVQRKLPDTLAYKADFVALHTAIEQQQQQSVTTLGYKDFITPPALKAFASAFVLTMGYQFSGAFSFINYMSTIFAASGSVWNANTCTIIIGVVQIVGVYTSTILVDIIGRRILMLTSTFGIALGCAAFGGFTYLAQLYDLSAYNWLPLLLMILIIYMANIGLIGIFFLVLVEMFPAKIRPLATSMSVIFLSVLIFCTLKLFPLLLHHAGISVTMWFSAICGLITFVYFLLCLPETKGKSMVED